MDQFIKVPGTLWDKLCNIVLELPVKMGADVFQEMKKVAEEYKASLKPVGEDGGPRSEN